MTEAAAPRPLVACMCAEWCGSCRDYRAVFARLGEAFAGRAEFVWIDVEDDAELVDEIEVENFPSLLVVVGERAVFFGPVTPQQAVAERLIGEALGPAPPSAAATVPAGLIERLRVRA